MGLVIFEKDFSYFIVGLIELPIMKLSDTLKNNPKLVPIQNPEDMLKVLCIFWGNCGFLIF